MDEFCCNCNGILDFLVSILELETSTDRCAVDSVQSVSSQPADSTFFLFAHDVDTQTGGCENLEISALILRSIDLEVSN